MKGHARNMMSERVVAVARQTSLEAVARDLIAARVTGVTVVDDDERVVGFVSEADLMGALLARGRAEGTAADIMSTKVVVIDEFAPSEEVMTLFRENRIHNLPVVRDGRLVGLITPRDVLRYFVDHVLPPAPEVG